MGGRSRGSRRSTQGSCWTRVLAAWFALLAAGALVLNAFVFPGVGQSETTRLLADAQDDANAKGAGGDIVAATVAELAETRSANAAAGGQRVKTLLQKLPGRQRATAGEAVPSQPEARGHAAAARSPRPIARGGGNADDPKANDGRSFDDLLAGKLEDNAPRPPPREGDRDIPSPVGHPLPGVGEETLHGDLNRLFGELAKPIPMPSHFTEKEKTEAYMGQCYNAVKSDSLSLDRRQPDKRAPECKRKHSQYGGGKPLPKASVVIVFHNEVASVLMRSVHSILNHSPPDLLDEIILVDDLSKPDPGRFLEERWRKLQQPLEEHVKQLPKVRLVRLAERRGLMLARMEGAWRAKGKVVIFLDSHIEATIGWIEPLVARIAEDRRRVVVPSIGSVGANDFKHHGGSGLGVLAFTWSLGQNPLGYSGDGVQPEPSPIMAGGLFASDRAFLLHLGGYDDKMRYYGGEEMEIGFRTWQCGGRIEYLPCSYVFHVFRESGSSAWKNHNSGGVAYYVPGLDITRNKLRTAQIWMDEYAKLAEYASPQLTPEFALGDMQQRKDLRKRLKCKSFDWYLKNVATMVSAPSIEGLTGGALKSNDMNGGCLDTLGGNKPGLYPCHGQHGSQAFMIDGSGRLRVPSGTFDQCMSGKLGKLLFAKCPPESIVREDFVWKLEGATSQFVVHLPDGSRRCLESGTKANQMSPLSLALARCAEKPGLQQQWSWQPW